VIENGEHKGKQGDRQFLKRGTRRQCLEEEIKNQKGKL
jgi:hypothetical protein